MNITFEFATRDDCPDRIVPSDLRMLVLKRDSQAKMLKAFRDASNSIGVETGTIASHIEHDEAVKSITGDAYFLELIKESEVRFNRLSLQHEKLRAASSTALDQLNAELDRLQELGQDFTKGTDVSDALYEVLNNG